MNKELIERLRFSSCSRCQEAIDALEAADNKLARKELIILALKARVANWDEMKERIAELEAENFQLDNEAEKWAGRYDKATLSIKRLDAALGRALPYVIQANQSAEAKHDNGPDYMDGGQYQIMQETTELIAEIRKARAGE